MSVYVSRIKGVGCRVPLGVPVLAPGLRIEYRDYLLVEIECTDGTSGIGFSYVGTGGASATTAVLQDLVSPLVLGADPTRIDELQRCLKFATRIQGRGGIVANALSAIDIALWDRNARSRELPLSVFINPAARASVSAYASGGYLAETDNADQLERELKGYIDAGFSSIKLKCAFGSIEEDIKRLTDVRRIIGHDNKLMLDAYNRWTRADVAAVRLREYLAFDPYWIEDPLEPDLLEELSELRREVDCRLATGEFYFGPAPFHTMVSHQAVSVFQPEAPRCGGVTDWLRIADMAEKAKIEVSPCWFHDLHVHLVAATPCAKHVEYFPTHEVLNFGVLIDNPVVARDGEIAVPQEPGLGFNFNWDAIERYALPNALDFEPKAA